MALQAGEQADFRIFGASTLPANPPFTPIFSEGSMAAGQNVAATSLSIPPSGPYPTIASVTLLPQTVNGTVSQIASQNGYGVYQVKLASYDPLNTNRTNGTITIYTDGQTQMLTSREAAVGAVLRFHGLVFSDQGTLRMIADSESYGVAE